MNAEMSASYNKHFFAVISYCVIRDAGSLVCLTKARCGTQHASEPGLEMLVGDGDGVWLVDSMAKCCIRVSGFKSCLPFLTPASC